LANVEVSCERLVHVEDDSLAVAHELASLERFTQSYLILTVSETAVESKTDIRFLRRRDTTSLTVLVSALFMKLISMSEAVSVVADESLVEKGTTVGAAMISIALPPHDAVPVFVYVTLFEPALAAVVVPAYADVPSPGVTDTRFVEFPLLESALVPFSLIPSTIIEFVPVVVTVMVREVEEP
jgi:hypothetical protein